MRSGLETETFQQTVECMGKTIRVEYDRYYTRDHLWIKVTSSGTLQIGITDYAQQFLKKNVALVELMKNRTIGKEVEEGEVFCTVYGGLYADPRTLEYECMAFDMFAPLKGTITEINPDVMDDPQLVSADCYDKGWIAIISPLHGSNFTNLLEPVKYLKLLRDLGKSPLRVL